MGANGCEVLIVGAGPTGLTLAVDLARRGIDCQVIEQDVAPLRQSRGKGLQPRSLEVLADLGVIDQIQRHGQHRQRVTLFKNRRQLASIPAGLAESRPDLPYPNIVMIPQWRTTEILRERLTGLGVTVRFGHRLTGFTDTGDGVSAAIDAPDGQYEINARYLVGTDGGKSTVRRQTGIPFEGDSRQSVRYLLGDVTLSGFAPGEPGLVRGFAWFDTEGGFLGLAELPHSSAWQIGMSVAAGEDIEASVPQFQRLWDERTGRSDVKIAEATWLSDFTVNIRMAGSYRNGRIFLAGDAAHVHPPTGGQGMNTGIQDAYNLGWKLALRLRGEAEDRLLDSYEAERMPIAREVLSKSTDILDVVMSGNALVAFGVQRIMLPLLSVSAINKALTSKVSQIDIGHRDGPLTHDEPGVGAIRAGDRAPDGIVTDPATGERLRLFDVLAGPQFTLLVFGEPELPWDELPKQVSTCVIGPGPTSASPRMRRLNDVDKNVTRAYGGKPGTVLLIRPDGYIAWRSRTATIGQLREYLASYLAMS